MKQLFNTAVYGAGTEAKIAFREGLNRIEVRICRLIDMNKDGVRNRILLQAGEIFAFRGFQNTTIRDISSEGPGPASANSAAARLGSVWARAKA